MEAGEASCSRAYWERSLSVWCEFILYSQKQKANLKEKQHFKDLFKHNILFKPVSCPFMVFCWFVLFFYFFFLEGWLISHPLLWEFWFGRREVVRGKSLWLNPRGEAPWVTAPTCVHRGLPPGVHLQHIDRLAGLLVMTALLLWHSSSWSPDF